MKEIHVWTIIEFFLLSLARFTNNKEKIRFSNQFLGMHLKIPFYGYDFELYWKHSHDFQMDWTLSHVVKQ